MKIHTFEVHWLDGKVETLKGFTLPDAFVRAGYGNGAILAIDYYKTLN